MTDPTPNPTNTTVFLVAGQSNSVGQAPFDGGVTYPAGVYQLSRYTTLPTMRTEAFATAQTVADSRIIPASHPLHH